MRIQSRRDSQRVVKGIKEDRDPKEVKDIKEVRDIKEDRDIKEIKDTKEDRDTRVKAKGIKNIKEVKMNTTRTKTSIANILINSNGLMNVMVQVL